MHRVERFHPALDQTEFDVRHAFSEAEFGLLIKEICGVEVAVQLRHEVRSGKSVSVEKVTQLAARRGTVFFAGHEVAWRASGGAVADVS